MKDLYSILEVAPTASLDVIKASAKALSARYHPDKETGDAAKFRAVRNALDVLSDPQKRKAYDDMGANGDGRASGFPQPPPPGAFRQVWMNGYGWVNAPADQPGTFPNDRPAYPQAYPPDLQQMAQEAAEEMAYNLVDQMLGNMFRGGRRRR